MQIDFGGADEIRFERRGHAGIVTLTRPKALNAVTHRMVLALSRALEAWAVDGEVKLVMIRGEGRAFSAGGDIVDIYREGRAGNLPLQFFADEYRLNMQIAAYPKPYVALIDGIAMGGGVGVSYHGSHRVVTENAAFAMPEVGIGFFPDVGGSYILPRLKGAVGMYLALTGGRMKWGDQFWCGLATHCVASAELDLLADELASAGEADAVLARFSRHVAQDIDESAAHAINRHFSLGSVEEIVKSLEQAAGEDQFAERALALIRQKSPTSLCVAFEQVSAGEALEFDECMRMEFRILNRMLAGHDFYEGIRAAVIDKDGKPQWRPPSLEEVSAEAVDAYFAPLDQELLP